MDYRDLPYDAEIEYLECTGTQYIDTGISSADTTEISIDAKLSEIILQCRIIGNDSGYFEYYVNGSSRWSGIANGTAYSGGASRPADMNRHVFKLSNITNKAYLDSDTWNMTHNTSTYWNKITLFGRNPGQLYSKGYIYSAQIKENGTLVRDFIPVRVGTIGYLYDKVSGKLFGNSGTGSFVLGPDVAPGRYANEVAFLESWGNQYIDTGIMPSTDTKIELKCLYCKSGAGLTNYGALIGADDRDNAYILNHSAVANFTYGLEFSNNFANPQTRLLTFNSTAAPHNLRVYDEGGSLVTTLTCMKGVFEVNQNLYLFATNRSGTPVYGSNRILYCKIYDGDTLVRDYVPIEYNGTGYMYDKVSGLFFDNKGTGKFLFGSIAKACARSYTRRQLMMDAAIIKPPQGYEWVEYIENTTTAYIDTGIVFRSGSMSLNAMELDMEIMELPSSSAVGIFGSRYRANDVDATFIEILTDGRYHTTINTTNYYSQASIGRHVYSIVADILYIDGVRFGSKTYPRHSGGTVGIFAIRERASNSFSSLGLKARLYQANISAYDNKRIFLPALRLSDNKYGLWDMVSNSFYVSPNNKNFTGGNIINRHTI